MKRTGPLSSFLSLWIQCWKIHVTFFLVDLLLLPNLLLHHPVQRVILLSRPNSLLGSIGTETGEIEAEFLKTRMRNRISESRGRVWSWLVYFLSVFLVFSCFIWVVLRWFLLQCNLLYLLLPKKEKVKLGGNFLQIKHSSECYAHVQETKHLYAFGYLVNTQIRAMESPISGSGGMIDQSFCVLKG